MIPLLQYIDSTSLRYDPSKIPLIEVLGFLAMPTFETRKLARL